MEDLCKQGKLKSIGVCNFNRKQLEDLLNNCSVKPVVNQIEVHLYCQNDRLIEFCQNNGITVVAYSPLGAVDLAESKDMPILLEDPVLIEIAKKHNKSPAQICIKWCLQRGLVVIPKALDKNCILENGLVFDFTLSDDDMSQIKKLNKNLRYFSAPE
jgi:diketogulonate reductase-like aldo/keto reductase